jgi:creatinine amidohydrolase
MYKAEPHHVNVLMEEMSWCQIADTLRSPFPVALLPIGSTEAHGPHLPLHTDAIIALEAVQRAARELQRRGIMALVLPLLSYGVSDYASPFPGTITLEPETLVHLIRDICLSTVNQGFQTVCLCSSHLEPMHFEALHKVARLVQEKTGMPTGIPDNREAEWASILTDEFRKGARHAGSYETSLVMAAKPALVKEGVRKDLAPVWIDLPTQAKLGAKNFREAGSDMAYFGDPAHASVEEGEMCFKALAKMIVVTVERLLQQRRKKTCPKERPGDQ